MKYVRSGRAHSQRRPCVASMDTRATVAPRLDPIKLACANQWRCPVLFAHAAPHKRQLQLRYLGLFFIACAAKVDMASWGRFWYEADQLEGCRLGQQLTQS